MIRMSPSGATRWLSCSGSLVTKGFAQENSNFAVEGTRAHALAEHCLVNKISPLDVEKFDYENYGEYFKDAEPDDTMAACIEGYVDFVEGLIAKSDYHEIEGTYKTVVAGDLMLTGTYDALTYEKEISLLNVIDLKYGMGLPVSAENNKQLMCYALLACFKTGITPKTVAIHVYQPRDLNGVRDDPLDTWYMKYEDLQDYYREIVKVAKNVDAGKIEYCIGDFCRWCKALTKCPKVYSEVKRLTNLGEAKNFTSEDLSTALTLVRALSKLDEGVKAEARRRLESAKPVPGYKLVNGNGSRKWLDEEDAKDELEERLGEKAYAPRKLLSVTKAEALVGKEELKEYWHKLPGKPRVAHESEKGKSITPSVDDVLNDIF